VTAVEFEARLEREALAALRRVDVDGAFGDGWHTHVDWKGEAVASPEHRQAELRVLFRLHDRLAARLTQRRDAWQLSASVFTDDPAQDLVQIDVPDGDRAFPVVQSELD